VLTSINQSFIREISQGDPEIYLTLFLGILDLKTLRLEHSSAGMHVPPLVISREAVSELFSVSDFPIGHVEGHEYETHISALSRDDVFVFASDGVVEARRGGELYGMERFKAEIGRIISERGDLDTAEVLGSVERFLGSERPQDDICLLAMSFPERPTTPEAGSTSGVARPGGGGAHPA
jgi:sigma-B regulation protein RsbU (phosphoserine phosphatase)